MNPPCPPNSFLYNLTQCACDPGHLLTSAGDACLLFQVSPEEAASFVGSGVGGESSLSFPQTIFDFDSIRKFTQSQAVFLEATLVMMLSWLCFCFLLRFRRLGDGRSRWFQMRWWISRLDVCFATRHWLDDQQFVKKRKTELGGTFSIASWILFIGLFAALLYQIISKRSIEVHNVRAANAPDLLTFVNDLEFNITTISSMSCSNLRGLGTIISGNPGFFDQRSASLSTFARYACHNTSVGPTISLKCSNCPLIQDPVYISWQFVDLPNDPAVAVGFQFNLTARNHLRPKHVSFISGVLKNRSTSDDTPVTFRGAELNILKFHLFPRVYHNLHGLKLIQPLLQEFLPGSGFSDPTQLKASLQSSKNGLINTTLYINPLSAYIVEIEKKNILGPVSFLADLGGIYCFSMCTFFYFLVQCEYRIKKLRNEDSIMRGIRMRRKAQDRWDKLRKYVMYRWGCSAVDDDTKNPKNVARFKGAITKTSRRYGSSHKERHQEKIDSLSFNKNASLPSTEILEVDDENRNFGGSNVEDASQAEIIPDFNDYTLPPPLSLEYNGTSEMDLSQIKNNLVKLYEYNVMLGEKFVATQSALQALTAKASSAKTRERKAAS